MQNVRIFFRSQLFTGPVHIPFQEISRILQQYDQVYISDFHIILTRF